MSEETERDFRAIKQEAKAPKQSPHSRDSYLPGHFGDRMSEVEYYGQRVSGEKK